MKPDKLKAIADLRARADAARNRHVQAQALYERAVAVLRKLLGDKDADPDRLLAKARRDLAKMRDGLSDDETKLGRKLAALSDRLDKIARRADG